MSSSTIAETYASLHMVPTTTMVLTSNTPKEQEQQLGFFLVRGLPVHRSSNFIRNLPIDVRLHIIPQLKGLGKSETWIPVYCHYTLIKHRLVAHRSIPPFLLILLSACPPEP